MSNDHTPPLYPVARTEGAPQLSLVQPWERAFARLRECREMVGIPDTEVLSPAVAKLLVFVCDEVRDIMKEVCDQEEEVTAAVEDAKDRVESVERQLAILQSTVAILLSRVGGPP